MLFLGTRAPRPTRLSQVTSGRHTFSQECLCTPGLHMLLVSRCMKTTIRQTSRTKTPKASKYYHHWTGIAAMIQKPHSSTHSRRGQPEMHKWCDCEKKTKKGCRHTHTHICRSNSMEPGDGIRGSALVLTFPILYSVLCTPYASYCT